MPGGTIVVTDALLSQAADADELAGVLAHEIEHVVQRHVLAGFLRGAVLSGLWSLTMGDYTGLLAIDPSMAYRVANLEFSRSDEQAADDFAVIRLHRAGISHKGLVRFFERLHKKYGAEGPAWLSTHPSTEARLARLRATPDVAAPREPLSADEFAALKQACNGEQHAR